MYVKSRNNNWLIHPSIPCHLSIESSRKYFSSTNLYCRPKGSQYQSSNVSQNWMESFGRFFSVASLVNMFRFLDILLSLRDN